MLPSRFRLRLPAATSLALLACLAWSTGPAASRSESPSGQAQQSTVVASLERYASGYFDDGVKQLIGTKNVRSILKEFRKQADAWIERAPEGQRPQRIAVTGAMSLELLAATFEQHRHEYAEARDLVEWACERFRKLPASDVERRFDLAAIALAQGAGDNSLVDDDAGGFGFGISTSPHAKHPLQRFPRDGRFMLAIATSHVEAQQITTWPLSLASIIRPTRGTYYDNETNAAEVIDYTLKALSELFDDPSVGGEARLRSGVLRFLRQDATRALTDLQHADKSQDPGVRHLAHLMIAVIADQTGDAGEALRRYRLAFESVPAATASVALASRLFRSGAAEDAAAVLQAFDSATPPPDPWEQYGQRDFRSFGELRHEMRKAVAGVMGRPQPTDAPVVVAPSVPLTFSAQTRNRSAVVSMPLQVQSGGKPVLDLTAADFALTDSGVPQDITAVEAEAKELDVTVVAQETTKAKSGKYQTLDPEIAAVTKALTSADRLTVMLAGRDPRPFTPPATRDVLRESALEERCVPIYDTLARALMQPVGSNRQRVVIVISAGEGRGGFLTTGRATEIARRASARVYVANIEPHGRYDHIARAVCPEVAVDFSKDRQNRLSFVLGDRELLLNDQKMRLVGIAESTAGREIRSSLFRGSTIGPLRDVLDEIRSSYVLRYTPAGVPNAGWHPITVRVTKPGRYDIRARPGYER